MLIQTFAFSSFTNACSPTAESAIRRVEDLRQALVLVFYGANGSAEWESLVVSRDRNLISSIHSWPNYTRVFGFPATSTELPTNHRHVVSVRTF